MALIEQARNVLVTLVSYMLAIAGLVGLVILKAVARLREALGV